MSESISRVNSFTFAERVVRVSSGLGSELVPEGELAALATSSARPAAEEFCKKQARINTDSKRFIWKQYVSQPTVCDVRELCVCSGS